MAPRLCHGLEIRDRIWAAWSTRSKTFLLLVECGVDRTDSRSEGPEIHALATPCFTPPKAVGTAIMGEMGDPQG